MHPMLNVSRLAFVTALVVALFPGGVEGQEQLRPFFGGGVAVGTGDLSANTDAGWLVFGGVDVPLGLSGVSIGVTGSHARIGYQGGFDEEAQITMVTGDFAYSYTGLSPRGVTPYLRAGLGLRVERYEPGRLAAASSTQSGIGGSVGAGLAVGVGRTTLLLGAFFMSGQDAGVWGGQGGIAIPVTF